MGDMVPLNGVWREFNKKFDFIPRDVFMDPRGKQAGVRQVGNQLAIKSRSLWAQTTSSLTLKPLFMVG